MTRGADTPMSERPNEQDAVDERDIVTKLWVEPPTHALAREAMDEIAELRWQLSIARKERDTARATAKRLNRRAQEAESKVAKASRTPVDTWSSAERRKEAAERDAGMAAVAKAAIRDAASKDSEGSGPGGRPWSEYTGRSDAKHGGPG